MAKAIISERLSQRTATRASKNRYLENVRKHGLLYLMILPGIVFYIVFKYVPLAGSVIAFQ
jgi:putative aldouronate transport system permease protein